MLFSYGKGEYFEGTKRASGELVLGEHKFYLRGASGDLVQTYVPLEKIERIKRTWSGLELHVRPTMVSSYRALIKGQARHLRELLKDLVARRGLRKRFLFPEWSDQDFFGR